MFFDEWMNEGPLEQCISKASLKHPIPGVTLNFPLGVRYGRVENWFGFRGQNNFKLQVYGYKWITRSYFANPL